MPYYSKRQFNLSGFEKSNRKGKMYNALLERVSDGKIIRVPFGSTQYQNYRDITGLNLYPHLIHRDTDRRRRYQARHQVYLKNGYYSSGLFSLLYLW